MERSFNHLNLCMFSIGIKEHTKRPLSSFFQNVVVKQSITNKNPTQKPTEVYTLISHFQYMVGKRCISIHHQHAKTLIFFQNVVGSLNTECGW